MITLIANLIGPNLTQKILRFSQRGFSLKTRVYTNLLTGTITFGLLNSVSFATAQKSVILLYHKSIITRDCLKYSNLFQLLLLPVMMSMLLLLLVPLLLQQMKFFLLFMKLLPLLQFQLQLPLLKTFLIFMTTMTPSLPLILLTTVIVPLLLVSVSLIWVHVFGKILVF